MFAQDRGTPLTPLGVVVDLYLGYNAGVGPVTNQIDPLSSCLRTSIPRACLGISSCFRTDFRRSNSTSAIHLFSALLARACVQVTNSWNVLPMSGNDTALDFLFKSQLFVASGLPDAELKTTPHGTHLHYIHTSLCMSRACHGRFIGKLTQQRPFSTRCVQGRLLTSSSPTLTQTSSLSTQSFYSSASTTSAMRSD